MTPTNALHKESLIARKFLVEFSGERVAFVPFYIHVAKQLCLEILDFFFVAFHYKYQPVCLRMVNEKVIFENFVRKGGKREINIAAKLRKKVYCK